jgi:hypothetical protein
MLHTLWYRRLLRLWYAKRNLLAIGCGNESTSFLCSRQACLDVAESDCVRANTE